ncbi:MAG TPA: hypothetical protein VIL35_00055 [Vicinamibacterales bacterium]
MQHLKDAYRSLAATPVVSVVAILSLALGIGSNTAIFSIVNTLLLRSLPVQAPEELAILQHGNGTSFTNPIWEQVREHEDLVAGALAWSSARFNLAAGGETDFVDGIWASGRFFDLQAW